MKPQPRYQPGNRIGDRYLVHKALMGGMGEVYLCLDLEEMKPYALKTFQRRHLSNKQYLRQVFEREVSTWVALEKHPNIVRCFHMDTLDNQPYMVLEWIAGDEEKGTDLRGWLRNSSLSLKVALEITIDICQGLIHAQTKQPGLVHRDLKPENILIGQGGLAKITDFGLAQIIKKAELQLSDVMPETDERRSFIGKQGIVGTPAYMAPEQWRDEVLDLRTDMYALGCILYEMLTGRPPFGSNFGPNAGQSMQSWLEKIRFAHEFNPYPWRPDVLNLDLDNLLQKILAKVPHERPPNLADLAAKLTIIYENNFDASPPTRPTSGYFSANDYTNRGVTYHALQKYKKALADYDKAIALDANFANAYANRAVTYAALHEQEQALSDYASAIHLEPNFAAAYSNRGVTYHALQRYKQALMDYDRALNLNPTFAEAYANRGNTHYALQNYAWAMTDYNQAIELDANLAKAYANRGITYHDLQEYEQALADYDRALTLNPTDTITYVNRGITNHILQRYKQALADYNRALELAPNDSGTYANRGIAHHALQQYKQALADYDKAVECNPNDVMAYYNRGNTYYELKDYESALVDYSCVIELDPNLVLAYMNRANTYVDLHRYEEALLDYHDAIKLAPHDTQLYYNRGIAYYILQQYELALADFDHTIQLEPNFAAGYINRGVIYRALHEYALALENFEKGAQLGESIGTHYASQIRQILGLESEKA